MTESLQEEFKELFELEDEENRLDSNEEMFLYKLVDKNKEALTQIQPKSKLIYSELKNEINHRINKWLYFQNILNLYIKIVDKLWKEEFPDWKTYIKKQKEKNIMNIIFKWQDKEKSLNSNFDHAWKRLKKIWVSNTVIDKIWKKLNTDFKNYEENWKYSEAVKTMQFVNRIRHDFYYKNMNIKDFEESMIKLIEDKELFDYFIKNQDLIHDYYNADWYWYANWTNLYDNLKALKEISKNWIEKNHKKMYLDFHRDIFESFWMTKENVETVVDFIEKNENWFDIKDVIDDYKYNTQISWWTKLNWLSWILVVLLSKNTLDEESIKKLSKEEIKKIKNIESIFKDFLKSKNVFWFAEDWVMRLF